LIHGRWKDTIASGLIARLVPREETVDHGADGPVEAAAVDRLKAVFRIHDILVWIRIRESMPLTMDPDPAIFVIDLPDASKN
jgi:hypothetical protein